MVAFLETIRFSVAHEGLLSKGNSILGRSQFQLVFLQWLLSFDTNMGMASDWKVVFLIDNAPAY